MKIALTRKVKEPVSAYESASIDVFIPEFTPEFIRDVGFRNSDAQSMGYIDSPNNGILIHPNGRFIIPIGIKVEIPEDTVLIAFNKSGVSWENRVALLAQVVDYGYSGEVFVSLHNYTQYKTILRPGQKLTQLLLIPVIKPEVQIVSEDQIYPNGSMRGSGSLGSSGK